MVYLLESPFRVQFKQNLQGIKPDYSRSSIGNTAILFEKMLNEMITSCLKVSPGKNEHREDYIQRHVNSELEDKRHSACAFI